ncbi:hypothetical protein [Sorangium cellulosum]|uniref:hypothetical protein n=1 Tax=Sorangium cellulosum TaxID=56 RepID=UPI0011DCB3A8|nr:hypothetical protein [Sorangium cellulosum]
MPEDTVAMDVEAFAALHPGMHPSLALFARAALYHHGGSPRSFRALKNGASHPATISFAPPDARTASTYEREKIVEFGAIVLAGLLLSAWAGKQITRVCKRGSRVDYFVGETLDDHRWVLEVGGTDDSSHQAKRTEKRQQLEDSFYRRAPFKMNGFVAVTRFAEPSVTSLDAVPAEAS